VFYFHSSNESEAKIKSLDILDNVFCFKRFLDTYLVRFCRYAPLNGMFDMLVGDFLVVDVWISIV